MYMCTYLSPIGKLTLFSGGTALTGLRTEAQSACSSPYGSCVYSDDLPVFHQTIHWLDAYFTHEPLPALPPLAPQGTPFRQAVWALLRTIPYGQTTTYGALARTLQCNGTPAAPQAVGGAVGRNPILILLPCHRVIGASGSLTGYAGGLARKQFLLDWERSSDQPAAQE